MQAEPDPGPPRRRRPHGIYAYTGREWDPETNLYYYRARYYDPKIGRFISEDPIGLRGGLNLYRYVANRPTLATDPAGLRINVTMSSACSVNRVPGLPGGITEYSGGWDPPGPCRCEDGKWGFDVEMRVTITTSYGTNVDPHSQSKETPGLTLWQHELCHVNDIMDRFNETTINAVFKTEGFGSKDECEAARRSFNKGMGNYDFATRYATWFFRDFAGMSR